MSDKQPKIEVFPDGNEEWRFHLISGAGEIQFQSEAYTRKADAERGAYDARENAAKAKIVTPD